ncbi:SDR family NAD(P)-dependent oxidoreductase [Lactobacillus sp. R2/2]|nr:SDR family NAD(P)-dependent oxidoreductase [Lactobacillus sp. R2/2]
MDNNLSDPLKRYHHDDFPKQSQEYPGLQSKMDPAPAGDMADYEGHGLLKGRNALVTGGDSGIGRAVAIGFAKEGADVAIQYLPEEESDAKDTAELIKRLDVKQFCCQLISVNVAKQQKLLKKLSKNWAV